MLLGFPGENQRSAEYAHVRIFCTEKSEFICYKFRAVFEDALMS